VIVRISTEDQYRLSDDHAARLNELDDQAVEAVEAGDEARFRELFDQMIQMVRNDGERVADDELSESDVILPPPDTTIEDARAEFTGEGLIPN
jgi:DNA-binding GntR family transcriptional regulator